MKCEIIVNIVYYNFFKAQHENLTLKHKYIEFMMIYDDEKQEILTFKKLKSDKPDLKMMKTVGD